MAGMYPLMTDAQRAGDACPWCNVPTVGTVVDLGEQHLQRAGVVIHPVACLPCATREARSSYATHRRMCVTCALDGGQCSDSQKLLALAQGVGLTDEVNAA